MNLCALSGIGNLLLFVAPQLQLADGVALHLVRPVGQTPFSFSGRGEVFSYSTAYQAPASHEDQASYTVALVKLEEGPLITAQLTDVDRKDVRIGMPVEMMTRVLQSNGDRGAIVYGIKTGTSKFKLARLTRALLTHSCAVFIRPPLKRVGQVRKLALF